MFFIKYARIKHPIGFVDRLRAEHAFGYEPEEEEGSSDESGDHISDWAPSRLETDYSYDGPD